MTNFALVLAFVVGAGQSTQGPTFVREFTVSGSKFVILDSKSGFPEEAGWELFLVKGGRRHPVAGFQSLHGRVSVADEPGALAFVRLRTFRQTKAFFGGGTLGMNGWQGELCGRSTLSLAHTFGDESLLAELRRSRNGTFGVLDDSDVSAFGLQNASVTKSGDRFVVRRTVMVRRGLGTRCDLVDVREEVGRDGSYRADMLSKVNSQGLQKYKWLAWLPR